MITPYDQLVARAYAFSVPLAQAFATVQQEQALAGTSPHVAVTIDVMRIAFGDALADLLAARICNGLATTELPARLTPLEWTYLTLSAIAALRREHVAIDTSRLRRLDTSSARESCLATLRATS